MTRYLTAVDPDYDTERAGYNLSVEHHPAVIVPAESVEDVIAAIALARERDTGVAVHATGHGPSRAADGEILVNTARMDTITIDPVARTARVAAGVRSGALVAAAAEHGLAPVNGSSPGVGVIGYHLGGGLGILGREFGWAVDHVRAIDVVTADGEVRRATATEHPDLFWALRGGGRGTLGVVVAIEVDLQPLARIYGGGMHFVADNAEPALRTWARWTLTAPAAMGTSALLIQMPDLPAIPAALRNQYVVHLRFAYTGGLTDGERLLRPFRQLGPVTDSVGEMPYAEVGTIHAEPDAPSAFHAANTFLEVLDDSTIDELLHHAGPDANAPYLVELRLLGAALASPGVVPSALARRDGNYVLYAGGPAAGEDVMPLRSRLDDLIEAMEPWSTAATCVSFLAGPDVTAARLATAYRPCDLDRLTRIKMTYDPTNVFRTHHSSDRTIVGMHPRDTHMSQILDQARGALTSERIRLRELRDGDLPSLVRWWRDPEVAVFNDRIQPRPDGPLEEMFRGWSRNGDSGGAGFCVETLDEELIGHVALFGADVRNRCATFAIVIGPEHQSQGLGTEATRLMVRYGFRELGLHRIELSVNADNTRGIAAYRKAGFEQEGLLRSKLFHGGEFRDQVVMAVLSPVQ